MSAVAPEMTDAERMANLGVEVVCKSEKLGTVRVRELTLEDLIGLFSDVALVLDSLAGNTDAVKAGGMAFVAQLVQNERTLSSVRKIAAVSTNKEPEDFVGLGLVDWLRIIAALKRVTDWEEIGRLFFEVVPRSSFSGLLAKVRET